MPKPSPDVGPKPKWRREGLPQLEVLRMVLLILSQPASAKMAGRAAVGRLGWLREVVAVTLRPSSSSLVIELRFGESEDELWSEKEGEE